MKKKRAEILKIVDEVKARRMDFAPALLSVGTVGSKVKLMISYETNDITYVVDELKKKLLTQSDQAEKTLLKDLEEKSKSKLELLKAQRKRLEADRECLLNSVSVSRSIAKNAPDAVLASMAPRVMEQLQSLASDQNFPTYPIDQKFLEAQIELPEELPALPVKYGTYTVPMQIHHFGPGTFNSSKPTPSAKKTTTKKRR